MLDKASDRPVPLSSSALANASASPGLVSPNTLKRQRSLTDADSNDPNNTQPRKRQSSISSFTPEADSRYSTQPTDVVSRYSVQGAIRSQQPLPARFPVMKAAILNSVWREDPAARELIDRKLNSSCNVPPHISQHPRSVHSITNSYSSHGHAVRETGIRTPDSEAPVPPSLSYTPNYDIFDDEYEDEYDTEGSLTGEGDAYTIFEDDSDRDDHATLCPLDEVLIEHHQAPMISSKPENTAIAKEIQFQMPSERLALDPSF